MATLFGLSTEDLAHLWNTMIEESNIPYQDYAIPEGGRSIHYPRELSGSNLASYTVHVCL